jgi:hypothetical protein
MLFARGFQEVANKVEQETGGIDTGGYKVGFTLDIISVRHRNQNCDGRTDEINKWWDTFNATPEDTGPHLRATDAVLAIEAFIPQVWTGFQFDESQSRPWKVNFIRRWVENGPPVFLDVDPGYRTHASPEGEFDARYPIVGWGWNDDWFNFQSELKATGVRGITYNTWNGYTERLSL